MKVRKLITASLSLIAIHLNITYCLRLNGSDNAKLSSSNQTVENSSLVSHRSPKCKFE